MSLAEDLTLRFLKYGAQLESAIIKAGYKELRAPEVVATIAYIACGVLRKLGCRSR